VDSNNNIYVYSDSRNGIENISAKKFSLPFRKIKSHERQCWKFFDFVFWKDSIYIFRPWGDITRVNVNDKKYTQYRIQKLFPFRFGNNNLVYPEIVQYDSILLIPIVRYNAVYNIRYSHSDTFGIAYNLSNNNFTWLIDSTVTRFDSIGYLFNNIVPYLENGKVKYNYALRYSISDNENNHFRSLSRRDSFFDGMEKLFISYNTGGFRLSDFIKGIQHDLCIQRSELFKLYFKFPLDFVKRLGESYNEEIQRVDVYLLDGKSGVEYKIPLPPGLVTNYKDGKFQYVCYNSERTKIMIYEIKLW
jgi:hypothetical protein